MHDGSGGEARLGAADTPPLWSSEHDCSGSLSHEPAVLSGDNPLSSGPLPQGSR